MHFIYSLEEQKMKLNVLHRILVCVLLVIIHWNIIVPSLVDGWMIQSIQQPFVLLKPLRRNALTTPSMAVVPLLRRQWGTLNRPNVRLYQQQTLNDNNNNNNNHNNLNNNNDIYIITGANGYIGRAIVHELIDTITNNNTHSSYNQSIMILCLVRSQHVIHEQMYWNEQQLQQRQQQLVHQHSHKKNDSTNTGTLSIDVYPYDMLDHGHTFQVALNVALQHLQLPSSSPEPQSRPITSHTRRPYLSLCVFHVASVFGPTDQYQQTAYDNVIGTTDLIHTLGRTIQQQQQLLSPSNNTNDNNNLKCKLILTSSMAAVRGTGQEPLNQLYYTSNDWNTNNVTDKSNWGNFYQWSKMESERQAWELCNHQWKDCITMTAICPSFVFGPSRRIDSSSSSSSSYSVALVNQWIRGTSPVQSRLFADLRDVAQAHVRAGNRDSANGQRIIVSTEARVSSQLIAQWIKDEVFQHWNNQTHTNNTTNETNNVDIQHPADKIHYDATFQGGSIPIGNKEVDATNTLQTILGMTLRPVKDTIIDMTKFLLLL